MMRKTILAASTALILAWLAASASTAQARPHEEGSDERPTPTPTATRTPTPRAEDRSSGNSSRDGNNGNGDGDRSDGNRGDSGGSRDGNRSGNDSGDGSDDGNDGKNGRSNSDGNNSGGNGRNRRAEVIMEFVSAAGGKVTWRLRPSRSDDLAVWDLRADSCRAEGGASCGNLISDGAGRFSASAGTNQALIVTQSFVTSGESCTVVNTAEFDTNERGSDRSAVTGTYRCSGAPALGWPLLALFVATGVAGAWWVKRKAAAWPAR